MQSDQFNSALSEVISALAAGFDSTFMPIDMARVQEAIDKCNPEHFHLMFTSPLGRMVEKSLLGDFKSQKAKFVFKHSEFLMRHFQSYFQTFEAGACSTDKARYCLKSIASHFCFDKPIVFDRDAQYTFDLPQTLNESQILCFFESLYNLYYGRSEPYLQFMSGVFTQRSGTNS